VARQGTRKPRNPAERIRQTLLRELSTLPENRDWERIHLLWNLSLRKKGGRR